MASTAAAAAAEVLCRHPSSDGTRLDELPSQRRSRHGCDWRGGGDILSWNNQHIPPAAKFLFWKEAAKKKNVRFSGSADATAAAIAVPPKVKFDDRVALLRLIKTCATEKNLSKTRFVHSDALKRRLVPHDVCISTALLDAFAKSGAMDEARALFDLLPVRNTVSWTALIAGYNVNHAPCEALRCFRQMQDEGIAADAVTYVCILRACGASRSLAMGGNICAMARKQSLLHGNLLLGNAAIGMFAQCGEMTKARHVFEELAVRDAVSWNTMIGGYAQQQQQQGRDGDSGAGAATAVECFRQMQKERVSPDVVTYLLVLKACAAAGGIDVGMEIDNAIRQQQNNGTVLLQKHQQMVVETALIDMYSKCGEMELARDVLERSPTRDAISWTALIAGYVYHDRAHDALHCFCWMQDSDGISPDCVTYAFALKACGIIGCAASGEQIAVQAAQRGLLPQLGNAMVAMYGRCGATNAAQETFHRLPVRDVVSWNSLLFAYAWSRRNADLLNCFQQMMMQQQQEAGDGGASVRPDAITYACVLKACAAAATLDLGRRIDAELQQRGDMQSVDIRLGNAIVDMYGGCGEMEAAREAFERLPVRDVGSWNALMGGYAKAGRATEALGMFQQLLLLSRVVGGGNVVVADGCTLLAVLAACSHAGLVGEGEAVFEEAMRGGGAVMAAEKQHYTCMVDLFGRAGDLGRAINVVLRHERQATDHLPPFLALMAACRTGGNLTVGKWAFQRTLDLDYGCAASYVCMGSIYAEAASMTPEVSRSNV